MSYGFEAPLAYYSVPKWLRWYRCDLTTDTCRIDGKHFFIVGNIRIPIRGRDTTFSWTAWVSLSKQNYERSLALWNSPGREEEPSYFGWLSSSIPGYPEPFGNDTAGDWAYGLEGREDLSYIDAALDKIQTRSLQSRLLEEIPWPVRG